MREIFRIPPNLPVSAYKTYSISAPRDTLIKLVCEQVGCAAWRNGWRTLIDESTPLGADQAAYIRTRGRRTFKEQRTAQGTVFLFDSGQRCFADHRTRREIYVVRDGDHRGNPTGRRRQHKSGADWVEDCAEHQLRIADQKRKG